MNDDDHRERPGNHDIDLLPSGQDRKAEKRRLKQLEAALETGQLDPWERYRVLSDLLETENDISEMADRKTRFALVVLGAVNAVNLFLVARPEIVLGNALTGAKWMGFYLTTYIALSLYIFFQSIGVLRPRVSALMLKIGQTGSDTESLMGLRFISSILETDFKPYYERWRHAQFGDINREIALSVKVVATVIAGKYQALHRVYACLMILVSLSAGLIIVLALARLLG